MNKLSNKLRERNSAIELLRIISMVGVVILHYNNASIGGGLRYVQEGSKNQYYLYFTENIFCCVVNLFILISAYFLSTNNQRKFIKIVELIVQVIVFNVVFYLEGVLFGHRIFSIKNFVGKFLPANYFVILYSVVYIVSPYINLLFNNLNKEQGRKLIVILVLLFSVWTILVDYLENMTGNTYMGLSTIGMYGSQYGYSIVNFLLIYSIGVYLRKYDIRISLKKLLEGIGITFTVLYFLSIGEHILKLKETSTWNYNNPLEILMAVLVLLLFLNFQFHSKIVNEFSKAAFTCFLLHGFFMNHLGIREIVNSNLSVLVLHQIGVGIVLYLISYFVYKVYYLCSHWLFVLLEPLCKKINISF